MVKKASKKISTRNKSISKTSKCIAKKLPVVKKVKILKQVKIVKKSKNSLKKPLEKKANKPAENKGLWIGLDLEYNYIIENAKKKDALLFPKTYQTYLHLPEVDCKEFPDNELQLIQLLRKITSPTSCYLPTIEKAKITAPIEKQFRVIKNMLHFYNDQQNCVSWLYDQKTKKVFVATIDYDKNDQPKVQILGECSKTLKEFIKRIQLESSIFFKVHYNQKKQKLNSEEEKYLIDLLKYAKSETKKVTPEQYVKNIQQNKK